MPTPSLKLFQIVCLESIWRRNAVKRCICYIDSLKYFKESTMSVHLFLCHTRGDHAFNGFKDIEICYTMP